MDFQTIFKKKVWNDVLNPQVGKHINIKVRNWKELKDINSRVLETIGAKNGREKVFRRSNRLNWGFDWFK